MYVIVARIKAYAATAARYETLIRDTADACARHACLVQFNVQRGGPDGTEFLLYEVWTDKRSYETLRSQPFFQAYLDARSALVEPHIERSDWTLVHAVHSQRSNSMEMPT